MEKKENLDLTEGSIPGKMIQFALPLFLGNLFQQLYNTADSLIVGNFLGSEALASVTSTGSLIFLLVGFFSGTAVGAGVIISNFYGAKDYKNLKIAIHTDIAFAVAAGILMTILGVIFTPAILRLMDSPPEVFGGSVEYLRVYFMGSLAVLLYNICTGILQAVGDSRHPLYYLIFSSIVNVILDYVFCGIFRLGVGYAALATIISQFLSVFLCLRRLVKVQDVYRVNLREVRFHKDMIRKIIIMGIPTGLQNSVIAIANVVVQSNINSFGQKAMAGCGSYSKIEGFAFLSITCFTMALTTFVGQNMGARKYDRVRKGIFFAIVCALTLAEITGIIIHIFAPDFIALFVEEQAVIEFGVLQARTVTLFYFLLSFSHVAAAILRGAGKPVVPMVVMLASWCLIRITYITIITRYVEDIRVVFWAYPITWSISSCIFIVYLWKVKSKLNYIT